jgi:hypothetical protein
VAGEPELHRRVQAERIHTKLARVERGSRTAILRRCRIVHGRHVVEKSDDLKAESRELLEWARAQGMDRLGLVPLSQFEHLIGSEIVDFDNGFLRVSVAPRLNARIVNLEWISEGRSLFASRDSRDSDWGRSGGYLERWLGAPPPDPMESTFGGWSTEGKMVGLYAYYAQPMYVWWAAGIEKTEPILRVSSRIINRSNGERDAAIECHWPFTLGKLDDVFVRLLKTGEEFDVQTAREHSAEQAGDGILLGNPRIGLGIRLIGSAECLASVTVRPVPAAGAVHVCLRTRSEIIIPAADARFQQSVEVLRLT